MSTRLNLAIDRLNHNSDGTIEEVVHTADGMPQLASLNPYVRVEAETTNAQSGIQTETCSEGGMNVTAVSDGDWIGLRGVDFGSGAESFTARVASAAAGGSIELRLGSATGTVIGTCAVPGTGGLQTWADVTCPVTGATGEANLYLAFTGGSFNVNHWQFTPVDGGAGGAAGASGGAGMAGSGGGGTTSAGAGGMGSGGDPVAGSSGGPLGGGSGTTATPTGDADETGGCGCRTPGRSSERTPSAWLVVAAALVATRRRRDRRVSTSVDE